MPIPLRLFGGQPVTNRLICVSAVASLALSSCSSKPRDFTPALQAPPADQAAYEQSYERCRTMVAQGRRSNFGAQVASGAVGTAAGVGAAAAATAGTYGSYAAAGAAMGAALVIMPVVGVAAAWGLAKNRRLRKEREIKQATAQCLGESGYAVSDWERTREGRRPAVVKASIVQPTAAPTPEAAAPSEPTALGSPQ